MSPTRAQSASPIAVSPRAAQTFIAKVPAADVALVGVVVTLIGEEPSVRVVTGPGDRIGLPSANYHLDSGEPLDATMRVAMADQIGIELGHLEQLACNVAPPASGTAASRLAIGYLALANVGEAATQDAHWRGWYTFFPWEDWRRGRPAILSELIEPRLRTWAALESAAADGGLTRLECLRMAFGLDGIGWDEERVVERFDLMQQAGVLGELASHRLPVGDLRTLAIAIGRLRSRIKSRPVVFDLMPERFTLFELQRTVEAILGPHLHKQNFRRLVEHMGLVEPTEGIKSHTGGRPAKLFKFRQSVLLERLQPGVRVRTVRG